MKGSTCLTRALIGQLFQKGVTTSGKRLGTVIADGELARGRTILKFRIVRNEGKRQVAEEIERSSAEAILAVGGLAWPVPMAGSSEAGTPRVEAAPVHSARKARIYRFLNVHSHHGHVAEPEHDLSVLSETGAVLGDVLALILATDAEHFRAMKELVAGVPETEVG